MPTPGELRLSGRVNRIARMGQRNEILLVTLVIAAAMALLVGPNTTTINAEGVTGPCRRAREQRRHS